MADKSAARPRQVDGFAVSRRAQSARGHEPSSGDVRYRDWSDTALDIIETSVKTENATGALNGGGAQQH